MVRITRRGALAAALAAAPVAWAAPTRAALGGVVTLEWNATENAIALGVPPAGVADLGAYADWVGIDTEFLAAAADVGTRQQPSMEAIARLAPRLIVATALRHRALQPRLAGIAPVLLLDDVPRDGDLYAGMVTGLRQLAAELGRPDGADREIAALDASLSRHREALAARGRGGVPVVLAQPLPGIPRLRLFTANSAAAGVLSRMGLAPGWSAPPEPFGFATVEAEALAALDQAHLLLIGDQVPSELATGPLWRRMPFVAAGRLHLLGPAIWTFGGPRSMNRLAERVAAALLA